MWGGRAPRGPLPIQQAHKPCYAKGYTLAVVRARARARASVGALDHHVVVCTSPHGAIQRRRGHDGIASKGHMTLNNAIGAHDKAHYTDLRRRCGPGRMRMWSYDAYPRLTTSMGLRRVGYAGIGPSLLCSTGGNTDNREQSRDVGVGGQLVCDVF